MEITTILTTFLGRAMRVHAPRIFTRLKAAAHASAAMCISVLLAAVLCFSQPAYASSISLSSNWSFQISGPNVVFGVDKITNNEAGGTSGKLVMDLWAYAWPYGGSTQPGWVLAEYEIGQLNGGASISNVSSGSIPVNLLPPGKYYVSLLVYETTNSGRVKVAYVSTDPGQTLICSGGNCVVNIATTSGTTSMSSDPAASLASLSANKAQYALNGGDALNLSGTIQAGSERGKVVDIYVGVLVYSPPGTYLGKFYLGPDWAWSAAEKPLVPGFSLDDVAAPNFYTIPVAGLPAGDYDFNLTVTLAGKSPNSSYPDIVRDTVSRSSVVSQAQTP